MAESTVGWFVVREKYYSLVEKVWLISQANSTIKAKHWHFADPTQKSRSSRTIGTGTSSRQSLIKVSRRLGRFGSLHPAGDVPASASKPACLPNFSLNCWLVSLIDDRWRCCHLKANLPVRLIAVIPTGTACICLHCTALHWHCFLY